MIAITSFMDAPFENPCGRSPIAAIRFKRRARLGNVLKSLKDRLETRATQDNRRCPVA
jgi:hypothetical protein